MTAADVQRSEVDVSGRGGPHETDPALVEARQQVVDHRRDVVRRLRARGCSEDLLCRLLPDWEALIRDPAASGRRR